MGAGAAARAAYSPPPVALRSLEQAVLALGRAAAAPGDAGGLGQRRLDVGQDRPLGARRDDGLGESLHVDVGAAAVAALGGLERHQREDAVGADEAPVTERDEPGIALRRHRPEGYCGFSRGSSLSSPFFTVRAQSSGKGGTTETPT